LRIKIKDVAGRQAGWQRRRAEGREGGRKGDSFNTSDAVLLCFQMLAHVAVGGGAGAGAGGGGGGSGPGPQAGLHPDAEVPLNLKAEVSVATPTTTCLMMLPPSPVHLGQHLSASVPVLI